MIVELIGGPRDGARVDIDGNQWLVPCARPTTFSAPDEYGYSYGNSGMVIAVYGPPLLKHSDRAHLALMFRGYK